MKLRQWIQILLISSSIAMLVGCHSARKVPNQTAINDANAAYTTHPTRTVAEAGARSSGLGEEARFGEQAGGGKKPFAANKTYYFDFDSNVVHEEDKPAIAANAGKIAANPKMKVLLEGHTDPRGSREYNIGLGERRAKAVAEIMTTKGVNPSQIRIVSYGAEKLATNGRTESDYQLDRRGVLVDLQR